MSSYNYQFQDAGKLHRLLFFNPFLASSSRVTRNDACRKARQRETAEA
jgi:hypothetical protein